MSTSSSSSLARSSAVMAAGTLVSRVLGLGRMALLAYAIGNNTPAGNVWETANTIPNTIYLLLAAGVLNVLLLPQLTRAMTRGREGQEFSDRLITLSLVVLGAGTVLFVLAAPLVTKLNAVAWAWDDPKLQLAILFAYLCIPQMLFYGVHTLLGQILAAHHRFAAFMWSPALANIIAIGGILLFLRLYPETSPRTEAPPLPLAEWTPDMIGLLAGSATLGIVVQALVLIPAVRATGFTWRWRWGFRGVGLGTASVMAGWALADVALSQGGMLVVTNLLNDAVDSAPGVAGKNAYTYAFAVFVLPHSLIALSLLTAIYPVLSKDAAADRLDVMAENTGRGLRLLGAAMVPIAVGVMLLAPLLVRVIYPASTPSAHSSIAAIVIAMTVGLVPYGVYLLCTRVFYSFEDARTPFLFQVSITSVLLTASVIAFFQPPTRVAIMLGLGQALGQGTAAVLGLRAVRRRLPGIGLRQVGGSYLRSLTAAVLALLPAALLVHVLDRSPEPTTGALTQPQSPESLVSALAALAVAGPVYLVVYAVLAHRLGVREVSEVASPVLRRVPGLRRLAPDGDPGTGQGVVPSLVPAEVQGPASGHGAAEYDRGGPDGTLGWDAVGASATGEDSSMDRLEVGTLLGDRYALDELLAEREGGSLQYWSARDVTLGRLVAVTVLPADGEDAAIAEAVLDGARRVASVDDPRLVRVLDVGQEDGLCWIIEEGLSDAESVASLVEEHPLPAEEVRRLVGESAAALESARRRGLHHLYLNPHAVLRTRDGAVKVSGVGVASALEGTDDVTADEASMIDSADLISLLYTGLTGRWPGEDLAGVRAARRLADGTLPAPSELVAGVPGDLDALCRLAHGSDADLQSVPHTPGELTRQLAPWSSEMVRRPRPDEVQGGTGGSERPDGRPGGAAAGATGAAGAAAAARSDTETGSGTGGSAQGRGDATTEVPRPYFRTDRGADSTEVHQPVTAGRDDDTMGGLLAAGAVRERRESGSGHAPQRAAAAGAAAASRRPAPARGEGRGPDDGDDEGLPEARGTGAQTVLVMLITLALLGVAVFLGWGVIRGLGDDEGQSAQPTAEAPADDASTASEEPAPAEDEEEEPAPEEEDDGSASGPVSIQGITSFDPQGDGDERNDLTPLAVDGDTETEWTSHTYLSPGWGSLKDGTGLVLDLGEGAEVGEVEVLLGEGEMGATLYLSDSPSLDGATELGSEDAASGTWTVSPEEAASGRYLILWFTTAWTSPEGEIVSVREISVS
ncbi:murein biosynthesis integral membrane protein MurJ [Ornithinimicrobium sp. LYQ92]|uniref:murein biosynthesis integral membrane protein MurJ n=1 Tax=Serinicoccus sp. LYQ92 TaxID=3378798 RepID=UPI0038527E52